MLLSGYSVLACSERLRARTCSCESARSANSDKYIPVCPPIILSGNLQLDSGHCWLMLKMGIRRGGDMTTTVTRNRTAAVATKSQGLVTHRLLGVSQEPLEFGHWGAIIGSTEQLYILALAKRLTWWQAAYLWWTRRFWNKEEADIIRETIARVCSACSVKMSTCATLTCKEPPMCIPE